MSGWGLDPSNWFTNTAAQRGGTHCGLLFNYIPRMFHEGQPQAVTTLSSFEFSEALRNS
jgi:hypothetical protein